MAQPFKAAMVARVSLGHLLDNFDDLRRPSPVSRCFIFVLATLWWMDGSITPHWAPRGCIYALWEPWGVLHLALHEIFLGREGNLVSIKSALSRHSCFVALTCRCHISHVRTLNNANLVSRLFGTKFPSTLVFITFHGNEDKISKSALEDNRFWFRTDCVIGISRVISPASLTRIGPSTCPNWRYHRGPHLW
jgi:hypothetical protein